MDTISIKGLSKSFSKVLVLNDMTLEIKKGKLYALLGHNGAGKTTLLKHILGLYRIRNTSSGFIRYSENGKAVKDYRKEILYVHGGRGSCPTAGGGKGAATGQKPCVSRQNRGSDPRASGTAAPSP
jgi:ABC-type multidrug transport system ATPase subunit